MASSGLISAGLGTVSIDVQVGPVGPVLMIVSWVPTGGQEVPAPMFDHLVAGGRAHHVLAVPPADITRMLLVEFHLDPGESVDVTVGQPGVPPKGPTTLTPSQPRLRLTVMP